MSAATLGRGTESATPTLQQTLAVVDERLQQVLDELEQSWQKLAAAPDALLGADDLPALTRRAARGGKRLRPQMVHWGWVCAGAPAESHRQVVELGAALELLHLFALVHDDVMDHSEQRRGGPSVHAVARQAHVERGGHGSAEDFGEHIAILVGDLLHAEADHLVAALPAAVRRTWRTMIIELVLGQRQDLTGTALERRDLDQALQVARLKSGSYTVQRPLQMGAELAEASPRAVECLLRYGRHAGEAFGLRDDLLGTWGDPRDTGKSSLDDLEAGKATVLLALAAQRLDAGDRALLARLGTGELERAELEALADRMVAAGVREQVEDLVASQVEMACAALDPAVLSSEGIAGLGAAAHAIAWRKS